MRSLISALVLSAIPCAVAQDLPNPKPGEAHEILAKDAGTWSSEVKMYFQGPTGPASVYKGVETNKVVSGGLYLRSEFTCKMGKRTFEGHSLLGYDPRSKAYVGTWVDNFSTAPSSLKGTYDSKSKTMTIYSKVFDPESGQELQQKQITTWESDTKKKFEIFLVVEAGGKKMDIKLMEMTSTKQK